MDHKPILTYCGDVPLFRSLESHITASVPLDSSEWRRSYGRPVKNVRVEASFQQFNTNILDKYKKGDWSILEHPVLHIYVTECNDVEVYKSSVKDEIDNWLKTLNSFGITDWMILLVETQDIKKTKNILPRTTVLDKIRLDFASKNGDRCLSILNPIKFEIRASESFRCLLQRIRHLMLTGYNKNIVKYEELIRANREKRNQENWNFIQYFLLQEQLAFVLEMLGLHCESLVQYDELDAMFSQFILNSAYGEKHKWLEIFEKPLSSFNGISMYKAKMNDTRQKIITNNVTLLEFRSYLFERQCVLLKEANKPWEIAERLSPFLFSTLREIEALKLETPDGALACWEFVCALEVLNICDEVLESKDIYKCSQHSAQIWNLAKDKLYELGKLCGLLPGFTPTSEQLHTVVQLSAGIGDSVVDEQKELSNKLTVVEKSDKKSHSPNRKPKVSATDRLKEALGSNKTFQKLYLELSELAISTYKHTSRLRSARLVGFDLGNFYCSLNEPHKAVVFFTDLLREFKTENWSCLISQTLLELANCYRKMDDNLSYTKTCAAIACSVDLEILVRTFYFDEFLKSLKTIKGSLSADNDSSANIAPLEDHFRILEVKLVSESRIIQDSYITVLLKIENDFPREIFTDHIALSYEALAKSAVDSSNISVPENANALLPFTLHLDYKQDNTLSSASVVCENKSKQPVRRSNSTKRKISPTVRRDFTNRLSVDNIVILPGINVIEFKSKAKRVGFWTFKQLSIHIESLDFLSQAFSIKTAPFEIATEASSVILNFMNLVAGIEQNVKLIVSAGSFHFPKDNSINLKCSKNLRMRRKYPDEDKEVEEFQRELTISLINFKSFETRSIELETICDLPGRREEKHIEQKVTLQCPWTRNDINIPLHFLPALIASCRLHSSGTRKFLQVVIKGVYDSKLILSNAEMKCGSYGVTLNNINPKSQNEIVICKNLTVSFLWEIQVEPLKTENELPIVHVDFSMQYAEFVKPDVKRNYACTFDVMDYTTLFRIQGKVEPTELCRVGSVCRLNLSISKVQDNPYNDLMYEVLADQNTWVVCGRTAGVITMQNKENESINLEVMPLNAGFLPLPNIRLSKYISSKSDMHPRLQPFPPGQIYNSTKSLQIHVLAGNNVTE